MRLVNRHLVVCLVLIGCSAEQVEQAAQSSRIEQALFDCASPTQRLACDPPDDAAKRFVCHATKSNQNRFVKISVPAASTHTPGVPDGNGRADQAPGASAQDLGEAVGLDCYCSPRVCGGTCTGAAAGTACDDGDRCTGDGACAGDTCQPGEPTCAAGRPVDACTV